MQCTGSPNLLHITALGNKIIHHNNAVLFQLSLKHLKLSLPYWIQQIYVIHKPAQFLVHIFWSPKKTINIKCFYLNTFKLNVLFQNFIFPILCFLLVHEYFCPGSYNLHFQLASGSFQDVGKLRFPRRTCFDRVYVYNKYLSTLLRHVQYLWLCINKD